MEMVPADLPARVPATPHSECGNRSAALAVAEVCIGLFKPKQNPSNDDPCAYFQRQYVEKLADVRSRAPAGDSESVSALLAFEGVARERVRRVRAAGWRRRTVCWNGFLRALDMHDVRPRSVSTPQAERARRGKAMGTLLGLLRERFGDNPAIIERVAEHAMVAEWRATSPSGTEVLDVFAEAVKTSAAAPFAVLGLLHPIDSLKKSIRLSMSRGNGVRVSPFAPRSYTPESVAWLVEGLGLRMSGVARTSLDLDTGHDMLDFRQLIVGGVVEAVLGWDEETAGRLGPALRAASEQVAAFNASGLPDEWFVQARSGEAVKQFRIALEGALHMRQIAGRLAPEAGPDAPRHPARARRRA